VKWPEKGENYETPESAKISDKFNNNNLDSLRENNPTLFLRYDIAFVKEIMGKES
jgi:hypothetical protein